MRSWVDEPCWWYLWWRGLAVTSLGTVLQWKMSCHLMEELPVALGRSVATGAMCVNLFPCHFFCLSSPSVHSPLPLSPPFFSFFLFYFFSLNPRSPRLNSLSPHSSMTNYCWRLICWLSKVLPALEVWSELQKKKTVLQPPCPPSSGCPDHLLFHPTSPSHVPPLWKSTSCLIRSHYIRFSC